jgi:hypothetical protein
MAAGCAGSNGERAASTTTPAPTTTIAPTTTTDVAEQACRDWEANPDPSGDALQQLMISRDTRIEEAARAVERETANGPTGAWFRALEELRHACQAAGYWD